MTIQSKSSQWRGREIWKNRLPWSSPTQSHMVCMLLYSNSQPLLHDGVALGVRVVVTTVEQYKTLDDSDQHMNRSLQMLHSGKTFNGSPWPASEYLLYVTKAPHGLHTHMTICRRS